MKKKFISPKMKMFILILFVFSIIFYISGFFLLLNSGYDFSTLKNKINSVRLSNIKFYMDRNNFNVPFYNSTIIDEYELNDDISSIYFNLSSQNLEINSYTGDTIKIEITGSKFSNNVELLRSQSDNKLTFSASSSMDSDLNINIYLPEELIRDCNISASTSNGDISAYNLESDSINFSTSNGDIYLSNMNLNYLTLKNYNGDINANNIFSYIETTFSSTYGDIYGDGTFGLFDSSNVYGEIYLNIDSISKDIFINCNSGNTTLIVPREADYKAYYNSLSGSLLSPDSSLSNGNKSNVLNITTNSGNAFIGVM